MHHACVARRRRAGWSRRISGRSSFSPGIRRRQETRQSQVTICLYADFCFRARRRAAPVGGIAAAPKVHTGGTRHGKHAPCACAPCAPPAYPRCALCVPALRTPACPYCVHGVLVCSLSSTCACSHACCACPCCACSSCAPSCWACGALVQRSPRSCGIRSSTSSTSRGCASPCFVLAPCMLALSRLRLPCSRCVHLLCVPLLCVSALCAFVQDYPHRELHRLTGALRSID